MDLWIVIDLMGAGRLVGVFDSAERAARVVGAFSHYYKVFPCRLNQIAPDVLDRTPDQAQRQWLAELMRESVD